jgi:Penicillin binding protein transpeptidase domain/Penicillin-binding Protein dimerisation domain
VQTELIRRRGPAWSGTRRRKLLTRAIPLAALAIAAFVAGVIEATAPARDERALAQHYASDWARGDYSGMYALLDTASRQRFTEQQFVAAYQRAAMTATLAKLIPGRVSGPDANFLHVRMGVRTRIFGALHETLNLAFSGSGSGARVHFTDASVFPGLQLGERLHRSVSLAPRAALLARDGTPLAEGPARTSPIPNVAGEIVGTLGAIPAADAPTYAAEGYPASAKVGLDGLERIFQPELAGRPGGSLDAGARVLAQTAPVPGHTVRTTIDPALEAASISAMGGHLAGIAAMDPRNGQVLALSGIAFSAPQPPGSTMKIITATGALEAGIVKLSSTFPVQTSATIGGYTLQNANGEACGGTFLNAFAVSCNSVFAPLGARLGGARLVNVAERFGFNHPPPFAGAAESTIPSAATIGSALAVGSSAIGQGKVLTTPLEMVDAGATIAMGGRRPVQTLELGQRPRFIHVTSRRVAAEVQRMMIAVVRFGTGTAAAIPGVTVAGKTGTAELRDTAVRPGGTPLTPAQLLQSTDAWFVGYAPVGAPRIAVAALFPNQGAGGATAAPAVHNVLAAALALHY